MEDEPRETSETTGAHPRRWINREFFESTLKRSKHYAALIGYLSFALALYSLHVAKQSTEEDRIRHQGEKSLESVLLFSERYEDIEQDTKNKVIAEQLDPVRYYERFWNLQYTQFIYFTNGLIPDRIYKTWLRSRYYEWSLNSEVRGLKYRDAYSKYIARYKLADGDFDKAMQSVFTGEHPLIKGNLAAP